VTDAFADVQMLDARERVTGALEMTIDRSMPGMAHVKVVRSPLPHGTVRSIAPAGAGGGPRRGARGGGRAPAARPRRSGG
jgi:hypothetical protein